ncbi:hypothetical protein CY34DRAFT_803537 [Suillus luteus UH-Slu-Lm8-n1]|uniref:Uncharacterized protein n=1 Tax=Suillus luteus UH-Slu-Lm8-n1 TaxID=930992 RepID=A0A0D0APJ0_9AGAM|nr:hypothetical protein CY34DRAFT_803537 [Suillus luteus UH-Slu-Lm8-n1]
MIKISKDERKDLRWLMTSSHNRGPCCPNPNYVALAGVNFTPELDLWPNCVVDLGL